MEHLLTAESVACIDAWTRVLRAMMEAANLTPSSTFAEVVRACERATTDTALRAAWLAVTHSDLEYLRCNQEARKWMALSQDKSMPATMADQNCDGHESARQTQRTLWQAVISIAENDRTASAHWGDAERWPDVVARLGRANATNCKCMLLLRFLRALSTLQDSDDTSPQVLSKGVCTLRAQGVWKRSTLYGGGRGLPRHGNARLCALGAMLFVCIGCVLAFMAFPLEPSC
jgi:hypothetical protein